MTTVIQDSGFLGCYLRGVNRSISVEAADVAGNEDQIDGIFFTDCTIDGQDENTTTAQSMILDSNTASALGRVVFTNCTMKNTPRQYGITINGNGGTLDLVNCRMEAEGNVLDLNGDDWRINIHGGRYRIVDNGGTASPGHIVDCAAAAANAYVTVTGNPRFEEIASNDAAIRLSDSTQAAWIMGPMTANKATGATGTTGISTATGAKVVHNDIIGTVDSETSGTGTYTDNGIL